MPQILDFNEERMQACRSRAKMRQQWAELDARREMRRAAMSTLPEEMPDYAGMLGAEIIRIDSTADVTRLPAGVFTGIISGRNVPSKPVTVPARQALMDALCGPWGRV